jgi:hypothetical protein
VSPVLRGWPNFNERLVGVIRGELSQRLQMFKLPRIDLWAPKKALHAADEA